MDNSFTDRSFTIRRAVPADIPAMIALDRESPTAAHWTENQYRDLLESGRIALCACASLNPGAASLSPESTSQTLLGFIVARPIPPEWELENIVVAPTSRRAGLGRQLLNAFLVEARETANEANSGAVFLEVRESNQAARSFYESAGFKQTGRRKSYYTEPLEDAIPYRLGLY
jgi:ribosomal-protein-alanine N-acetyltransferase